MQGVWLPAGENVKLTVAVKVLRDGTAAASNQSRDLLEEARIMASVSHPCCVRIAAVCMTRQMMVVTQLMQYGCVLDFIRRQKDNVGARLLLRWAAQIASVSRHDSTRKKKKPELKMFCQTYTARKPPKSPGSDGMVPSAAE